MVRNISVIFVIAASLPASQLPFVFEHNDGQTAADVRYVSRAGVESIALLNGGSFRSKGIEVRLAGADVHAAVSGVDRLAGHSNYFSGGDPRRWHTGIAQFAQVRYRGVYPGIDLAFHGREYDFLIAPHSDANRIVLEFCGGVRPHLDNGEVSGWVWSSTVASEL